MPQGILFVNMFCTEHSVKLMFTASPAEAKRLRHSRFVICANIYVAIRNMMSEQHHISAICLDNTRKRSVFNRTFSKCDGYVCKNDIT